MGLVADLPSHHDLQRLWTAAYPIVIKYHSQKDVDLAVVRQVIDDYHAADPNSISFRYPVTKANKPVDHASFVHSFSHQQHASQFAAASEALDVTISRLRFAEIFVDFREAKSDEGDREGLRNAGE